MARRPSKSNLIFGLYGGTDGAEASLAKSSVTVSESMYSPIVKSILNSLNGEPDSVERLAFDVSPSIRNNYAGVYRAKLRLIPDDVLKRIAIQDSLVSNIVRARQEHISSFGRPRADRFSIGFVVDPNTGVVDDMDEEAKKDFNARIKKAVRLITTCGHVTENVPEEDRATFSEYLSLSTRSAVVCGRIATEIIFVDDGMGGKKFLRWVATDAGTIYQASHDQGALQQVRDSAYDLLAQVNGKDADDLKRVGRERDPEYTWVQVIDGKADQVFTSDEMKVYNFYAVPDVELGGYPVTPIDTVISAITTHINIVTHNKLYFQSGRATRGMLVITSDDVNPQVIHNIKQSFNANINNVNNSWRMPVFGVGTGETVQWQPLDVGSGRDMEFQYLTDLNAREILTAFMMSPDELPGWSYLSKGTNNQALSESNNEYKLQAARDVGIRPLLHKFEDFVNTHLFPLIDPDLAQRCRVKLVGLEADNAEKEAVRLQQDMALWETYDGVLERVEKRPLGKRWCGTIPLNPTIKGYIDAYFTVGEILEHFCGIVGAAKDPNLAYRRDQFFFSWLQYQQAQQQAAQAAQAAQQAAQPPPGGGGPPQGGGGDGGDSSGGGDAQSVPTSKQQAGQETSASGGAQGQGASAGPDELARSIDVAYDALVKAESVLPPAKRHLLAAQRHTVDHVMKGFLEDAAAATAEILAAAQAAAPKDA